MPQKIASTANGHSNGNHVLEIAAHEAGNGHAPSNGNGHNGNGHAPSNGHNGNGYAASNGNGHTPAPPAEAPAGARAGVGASASAPDAHHLSLAMAELMSHMDETVGLIRSMRPEK
jgi:hypothetical protein